jgi:glucokinase
MHETSGTGGLRLIGDIGGTNARFAVAEDGHCADMHHVAVKDHPTLQGALQAYLATLPPARRPRRAVLAIAGPVAGDAIHLTNSAWSFSITELRRALGLSALIIVNDFAATAFAVPFLPASELEVVGPKLPTLQGPVGVIGPGTGLGVGALLPVDGRWVSLPGEGGHVTMAAVDDEQADLLSRLRRRFDHVSAERLLSGAGLVNLYAVLCERDGVTAAPLAPADVTDRAVHGQDAQCTRAFALFCAMLGTAAGDLALTLGARGGIYIAGGILPRFREAFAASAFRVRFEAKGRFRDYLATVPTTLILDDTPALRGLANWPLPPE